MAGTATATMLDTDVLTPLGAYLRLRKLGRASFLLESVEQGRLGRYSLVGAGSRLLDFEEAERCGEPVVGYLAYDFVARLEPTVPLPAAGRGLPASRFVARHTLVRFAHVRGDAARAQPDRGLAPPRRRRRRASARLREGSRGARDARRPRAQRPVARLRAGERARRAVPGGGAVLAHHAPRLRGRGRAARRR